MDTPFPAPARPQRGVRRAAAVRKRLPVGRACASVDLDRLTREWDEQEAQLGEESYNQYAGHPFQEARMEQISARIEALAGEGLRSFARKDLPPLLWQGMVAAGAASRYTKLQNELYRLRDEAVVVDAAGEKVSLNSVRLFNHRHRRDGALRKRVFDGLMEKARALTPNLEARFTLSASLWGAHGMTPLDVYLKEERLTRARLVEVVESSARAARPAFLKAAEAFAREVLGKPFEAHDDMYVFRHAVFEPVDPAFAKLDFEAEFRKVGDRLGFATSTVGIDGEARPGKFASPICFGVRIPGDVRVLYQRTTPIGDYESFYHEMGHALHFISVDAQRAFEERRMIPNGVAEIFSTLFEALSMDPIYLREDLGLAPSVVEDVQRRRRFMELYFLTFYGANSLHKVRFWEERLWEDLDAADEAYAELTERCMGVRLPGIYWQTHHVLSMSDMYAPSYLLANIRSRELMALLERECGRRWWREPRAGAILRERMMGPGAGIDLDAFSRLDADAYVGPIARGD